MSFFGLENLPGFDLFVVGIATALTIILGYVIYSNNPKESTNRAFFVLAIVWSFWAISNYLNYQITTLTQDVTFVLWTLRIHLFLAVGHAFSLFYFSLVFSKYDYKSLPKWIRHFLFPFVGFVALITLTPIALKEVIEPITALQAPPTVQGPGMLLFGLTSIGLNIASFYILFKNWRLSSNPQERIRFQSIFVAAVLTVPIILLFNLILPTVAENFSLIPLGAVLVFVFALTTGYSIFRYHLLNAKILVTELLSFFILLLAFVDVARSETLEDRLIRTIVFLFLLPITLLLIRSVRREVEQREKIEELAKSLEKANARLRELDRLKSEFVSIASHQLRSPLTAIKGYASLILEGSFGKVNDAVKEAVQKMFDSSSLMAVSVQDFLDVSRIEQGKMKYNFEDFDLEKLLTTVVEELSSVAKEKGLQFNCAITPDEKYMVHADLGKIKQVLYNLIDNSIKYTPKGSVSVVMCRIGDKIDVEIRDTGVGISKETLPKLFDKFVRSRNAHHVNVSGTGLGLFVVKQMVEAHGGTVWATSEGEGNGSIFHVELKALTEQKFES